MTQKAMQVSIETNVKWEIDENPDLSHLGEYTDTFEEGAIDREKLGHMKSGQFRYFVPMNHRVYDKKDWDHVSAKDKRELILKHGSLKNTTRFYAMEDYKRYEAYNDDKWHMTVCIVTARFGALSATASLHGVESDCGEDYRKEVERDVASDAIADLREKMKKRMEVE